MICYIYDERGAKLLRKEERVPVCGEDFCDRCGDCLVCDADMTCPGGAHWWVKYESPAPTGGAMSDEPRFNYRDLLRRYIDHVGDEEGCIYLSDWRDWQKRFSEAEWEELKRIADEPSPSDPT